jgi:trimethylamine--corrinoid protein Co-methyltransferase
MQGFEVNEETLALDVIENAVGGGQAFLASEHTVDHFRQAHWFPELLDRSFFENWAARGRKDMALRCREKLVGILAAEAPDPPPAEVCRELDRIAEAALRDA